MVLKGLRIKVKEGVWGEWWGDGRDFEKEIRLLCWQ
jgi:hypothetical protein